jgi:hypothetical protein
MSREMGACVRVPAAASAFVPSSYESETTQATSTYGG